MSSILKKKSSLKDTEIKLFLSNFLHLIFAERMVDWWTKDRGCQNCRKNRSIVPRTVPPN